MSFFVTNLATLLLQPALIATLAIGAGLMLLARGGRRRLGAVLGWGGLSFFVIVGYSPLSNAMLVPLEDRFAKGDLGDASDIEGVIVLGGFEDGWVSSGRGGLQVNEAAERLTETVRLARKFPKLRVVFTGGVGTIWGAGAEATGPVQEFLVDMGVAPERITLEGKSRNTYENALFTAEILKPKRSERWVLVTTASHMPRSMGLFRKAGFNVIPYPVDYKTRGAEDASRPFERLNQGLVRFDTAFNEWAGLLGYWLAGRLDELFPAP